MTLNDISCFQVDISIAFFLPVPYKLQSVTARIASQVIGCVVGVVSFDAVSKKNPRDDVKTNDQEGDYFLAS